MKWVVVLLSVLLVPFLVSADVLFVEVKDSITSADAEMFREAVGFAESNGMEAIIMELRTPGGTVADTLKIIEEIEKTKIPVIGYVSPSGAYAWSAGTFLLISSDVAAMSPFTVIGSAQPVSFGLSGSEPISDSKTVNALEALFIEKARKHSRNESAASAFVKENLNLNEKEAVEQNVIEVVAETAEDLLRKTDGMLVKGMRLETAGDSIILYNAGPRIGLLSIITDPILSSIMLLVGIYALIFGLSSPGIGAEIAGVILIIMGILGLGFSVNIASIALIIFGAALLVAEIASPGFGILGTGGIISLVMGIVFLVPGSYPGYLISRDAANAALLSLIVPSAIIAAFFAFAFYKIAQIRRKTPLFREMVGEEVTAVDRIGPKGNGFVRYRGELWEAKSNAWIKKGDAAVITRKYGSLLEVEPKELKKNGKNK